MSDTFRYIEAGSIRTLGVGGHFVAGRLHRGHARAGLFAVGHCGFEDGEYFTKKRWSLVENEGRGGEEEALNDQSSKAADCAPRRLRG